MKQEKEDSWTDFIGYTGNYCLNSLGWTSGLCTTYSLGTIFKRELLITKSGTPVDQVESTVTVSWQDMNTVLSVPIKTVFKLLE